MRVIREKNAPDFLIVGAAKSGTTSLWYYLNQHPMIFMNQGVKELGFFSDHYGIKDFDEYLKYFDAAKPDQIIGEACHAYLSSPESAQKIFGFNPNMKIVMILRNPVHRAYSLYNWMVEHGWEGTQTFEKALENEKSLLNDPTFKETNTFYYMNYMYFASGLYFEQVKRYFDIFPVGQIKLIIYEQFKIDNQAYLKSILDFLNVSNTIDFNLEKKNESIRIKSPRLQRLLTRHFIYLADKYYMPRKLSSTLSKQLMRYNKQSKKPDKLNVETESYLFDKYRTDIEKLSDFLKVDLQQFWIPSKA